MTKWWAAIAGTISGILNITIGTLAITLHLKGREVLGFNIGGEDWRNSTWTLGGVTLIVLELIGQFCYYFLRKGAVRYADW